MTTKLLLKVITACLLICVLISCTDNHIENKEWVNTFPLYQDEKSLSATKSKTFLLDSLTELKFSLIEYNEKYNMIVGFNPHNRNFVFYDYASTDLLRKISFADRKFDSLGHYLPFCYSFHFVDYDSIILLNQKGSNLLLIDTTGRIIQQYDLTSTDRSYSPPTFLLGEPICYTGNTISVPVFPGKDIYAAGVTLPDNLVLKIDLSANKKSVCVRYPRLYGDAVWGEYMHHFYTAYNKDKDQWIYSFPVDHSVYVYDDACRHVSKVYAGSKHFEKVIPLEFGEKLTHELGKNEELDNLRTQHTYNRIIYDPYQKYYYRIVTNSTRPEDLPRVDARDTTFVHSPFSIVILDSGFKKVGEQDFDANRYFPTFMFLSKEGLCIGRRDVDLENQLTYDVFRLQ